LPGRARVIAVSVSLQAAALASLGITMADVDDVQVSGVAIDSRAVTRGDVFACVRGDHADGHEFAATAVKAGAVALLVDHQLDLPVPQLVVTDTRRAVGPLASYVFGEPSRALTMVGVTGTNGKTTTTQLVASILDHVGRRTGVIGTLTGAHTTPEAPDLQRQLAAFRDAGNSAVAMEVSSHALALHRVDGTHFDVGVFTNLGHDHLDLHGTQERYFAAKAMLFEPQRCGIAVVNIDDVHGRLLADAADVPVVTFSRSDVHNVSVGAAQLSFEWCGVTIAVGIGAEFNVMNTLAAATACRALGIAPADIAAGLAAAQPVPGRFEPIRAGQHFDVIVDYAHTPDGLAAVLAAARACNERGRLTVVFGCGGDRDRAKRPEMGAVAARFADGVIVTSDNPRSEDPHSIIAAIVDGVDADARDRVEVEPDRRAAIGRAISQAAAGDIVVIAGKGHENTQTVGAQVLPFDDRQVAREWLGTR
jgi:UDP-N-acetylmuramoyl-L-alanyl-D-glutamate--2,6-diaminopimelate ligase